MATLVTMKSEHTFVTRQGETGRERHCARPSPDSHSDATNHNSDFLPAAGAAAEAATPGPGPSSQVEPNHLSVRPSIRRAASNRPTRGALMNGHRPNVRMRHHSPDAAACYNGSGLFALFNEMEIIFLIIAEVTFSAGDFPLFLGPSVGVVTHATQARYRASRHKVKISRGYRRHQHEPKGGGQRTEMMNLSKDRRAITEWREISFALSSPSPSS